MFLSERYSCNMQQVTPVAQVHWRSTVSAYINLMKPHVTVLLLGTTLAAMTVASPSGLSLGLVVATLTGGALAAGSANALNCYIDRDIDQIMTRTRSRSLPAHRLPETHALAFGILLGIASFSVLYTFVGSLSAFLALGAILFYVLVYTLMLKRTTPQNIVIGGAAGAVPVLVGWAAATQHVGLPAMWMFLIIFLWTPPHFWALSLVLKRDYERAHVPMLPVVAGEVETFRQIILYTLLLLAASLMLYVTHTLGIFYVVVASALGMGLLVFAIILSVKRTLKLARMVFWFSNYYLALLFAAMVVDHLFR